MQIHYLGPRKTFGEQAARELARKYSFPHELVPVSSHGMVARNVKEGKAEFGVIAYYNYLEGLVQENLDLMYEYGLSICSSQRVNVIFALGGRGIPHTVYSHPKGLAQCSEFLLEHYPHGVQSETKSTADAVEKVLQEGEGLAIASEDAIREGGLELLAIDIGNKRHGVTNHTDFYLISSGAREFENASAEYCTMLAITPKTDEPKLLARILAVPGSFDLNLTTIHSRPALDDVGIQGHPQMFYLEVLAHHSSTALRKSIDILQEQMNIPVKVLGSYPKL